MIDQITPIILTYNEARNVARNLERLRWADDIVVVDSYSTDDTVDILSLFPQVRLYQRTFDNFAAQWNFALQETNISTEWVLTLDADFLLTPELLTELDRLEPDANIKGYRAPLVYCIQGKPLRSSLLPGLPVLYRRKSATCLADGHAYQIQLDGDLDMLHGPIHHDDRKPLREWLAAQFRYAPLEAMKLLNTEAKDLKTADRIRKLRVIAPAAIFIYCLLRGGVFDGWAGIYYALQRAFAELLLSLHLLEHDLTAPQMVTSQKDTRPYTETLKSDHVDVA
jgi:glycosyltransferase involved in cell wall biosynthesis